MKITEGIERSFKDKLKTQNNFYVPQMNKDFIPKWSGQQFYLKIKQKIHQKIRTQPFQLERFGKYNKNSNGKKPNHSKSKLVINTLELALQPAYCKNNNYTELKNEKCIHAKLQQKRQNLKKMYSRPNRSAKLIRQDVQSPQKEKNYPSCRLHQRSQNQNDSSSILKPNDQKVSLQRFKQRVSQTKKLRLTKANSQSHLRSSIKLRKNQISKSQNQNIVKNNVFLFYFESRHNIKASSREKNINRIRKSKTVCTFK